MLTNDDILMISDLMDKKLKPIEMRFDQMQGQMDLRFDLIQNQINHMNLLMENNILPRLQNIESCYVDTYSRYVVKMEEMDSLKLDMDVVKDVLKEHSDKLKTM